MDAAAQYRHLIALGREEFPASAAPAAFVRFTGAGASFQDRITIGRTSNNDVVVSDHSVSRLHAYVRQQADGWIVADAGSKNRFAALGGS